MRKSLEQLFAEFTYECEFVRKIRPETLRGYKQSFKTFTKLLPGIATTEIAIPAITTFFKILQERKRIIGKGTIKTALKNQQSLLIGQNLMPSLHGF